MLASVSCHELIGSEEKNSAQEIVTKKYQEQGYLQEGEDNSIASFLSPEHSVTFGAFLGKELYGTLSLVKESVKGFPMEVLYHEEVNELRKKLGTLAEVVQFAVDQTIVKKHLNFIEASLATGPLFAAILSYAEYFHIDALCISVNPKHVSFYSSMGFERFGEEKHYDAVEAPAVPMFLLVSRVSHTLFSQSMIGKLIQRFKTPYTPLSLT